MMTLKDFFTENPRCALGLSGGVDSTYLLSAGLDCGAEIKPYFIKTQFQPEFELRDAESVCRLLGVSLEVIKLDILSAPCVAENPSERCYYCKSALFSALRSRALADGFSTLIDGTNASDDALDRPGMRALREMQVRSPLRECGISKAQVRALSRTRGLPTADKPAYACLATRIPTGEAITAEKLCAIETAEDRLFALGYDDFRVRTRNGAALLQFPLSQLSRAHAEEKMLAEKLGDLFTGVTIDPVGR